MKAYILSDAEYETTAFQQLDRTVRGHLEKKGYAIETFRIEKEALAFCCGCFGCWVKKPGECVIPDPIAQINRSAMNSDVVLYLCPVVFGQFSANMKNAIDRWLPNMLPFFEIRPDGSTMHPARYDDYPKQILVGYGEELSEQDARLFADITKKHRRGVEVLFWKDSASEIEKDLDEIRLERVGGLL